MKTSIVLCMLMITILISKSAKNLQHSLNVISEHADTWKSKINAKKSNIMNFNKNGRLRNSTDFFCQGEKLDITESQTNLGLVFTLSAKFSLARETLNKKGQKVLGCFRSLLSNSDHLPFQFQLKLFDTLLKLVLIYGCKIWRPELMSYKTNLDKCQIEQMHLKFCKLVLLVPCMACPKHRRQSRAWSLSTKPRNQNCYLQLHDKTIL